MNTNIKPFYIYTERNSLYIKNINESSERLASNIYIYSIKIAFQPIIYPFFMILYINYNHKILMHKEMNKFDKNRRF